MSPNEEKAIRTDFESYLCGKEPDAVALATAPRLTNWSVGITKFGGDHQMYLTGRVTGHPVYPDSKNITTSAVVWLDPARRWARTRTRVYVLETPLVERP